MCRYVPRTYYFRFLQQPQKEAEGGKVTHCHIGPWNVLELRPKPSLCQFKDHVLGHG